MAKRHHHSLILTSLVCAILLAFQASMIGCSKQEPQPTPAPESVRKTVSPAAEGLQAAPHPTSPSRGDAAAADDLHYDPFAIRGAESLRELRTKLGDEGLRTVLKLNRIDDRHIRRGETLVIPNPIRDFNSLSPFPGEIASLRPIPKLLLVSRRIQAFGAYEFGTLVRWGPTSTGKKSTPTRAGLYHTNWKARQRRSTENPAWLLRWYINLDNLRGVSLHQYALPGHPASHGCIRLLEEDARWIYNWADQWKLSRDGRSILVQGTPVIVFGEYPYGGPPPWKRLLDDVNATTITKNEIEAALHTYLPII